MYAVVFISTDKPTTKTSATVSTATGNVSQPVEKSSMVTRRAHVTNDYASKKSTAATDLESMSATIIIYNKSSVYVVILLCTLHM